MPNGSKDFIGGEKISRAFFAALLSAQKSDCDCDTCKILRSIGSELTKEFIGEKSA